MLTGDKGETAHNIGISCGLIDPAAHQVFKIKGVNREVLKKELNTILSQIPKFKENLQASITTTKNSNNKIRSSDIELAF
jgi:magnesium-transporting ATPase (P-type)